MFLTLRSNIGQAERQAFFSSDVNMTHFERMVATTLRNAESTHFFTDSSYLYVSAVAFK